MLLVSTNPTYYFSPQYTHLSSKDSNNLREMRTLDQEKDGKGFWMVLEKVFLHGNTWKYCHECGRKCLNIGTNKPMQFYLINQVLDKITPSNISLAGKSSNLKLVVV